MESAIHIELEQVYDRLKAGDYLAALDSLARLLPSDDDIAVSRAVHVFIDEFFRHRQDGSPHEAQILEKLLLLDQSDRVELTPERREEVVLRLVRMHEAEPDLAVSYARFMPEHPVCSSILENAGPAVSDRLTAAGAPVSIHRIGRGHHETEASWPDGLRSLYRSEVERRFHRATVEVFPHFLSIPNVALQTVVDFEAVQERLTDMERSYFFRALIDVVVFDPLRDMRPVHLFELDSPFHDDPNARERDAMKNRIIEAAGAVLYRIRPADVRAEPAVFSAVLRRITRLD